MTRTTTKWTLTCQNTTSCDTLQSSVMPWPTALASPLHE